MTHKERAIDALHAECSRLQDERHFLSSRCNPEDADRLEQLSDKIYQIRAEITYAVRQPDEKTEDN